MNNLLAAALKCADLGWHVHPLRADSKVPLLPAWQERATTDASQIREWWADNPRSNVGVHCGASHLVVVDVDCKGKQNGIATLEQLRRAGKALPKTAWAVTPSGGWHCYYRLARPLPSGARFRLPGIDIQRGNKYVVAPPSIASGRPYSWIDGPAGAHLPELPEWLLKELLKPVERKANLDRMRKLALTSPGQATSRAERCLQGMCNKLAQEGVGGRNNLLNWCAYRAATELEPLGLPRQQIIASLVAAAEAAGLDKSEVIATIRSAFRSSSGDT